MMSFHVGLLKQFHGEVLEHPPFFFRCNGGRIPINFIYIGAYCKLNKLISSAMYKCIMGHVSFGLHIENKTVTPILIEGGTSSDSGRDDPSLVLLTQNVHLAPNTQQAEQAGFTRAKMCQSIFPEN
jgi:hypothetical protein